jgi:hypothetical protein
MLSDSLNGKQDGSNSFNLHDLDDIQQSTGIVGTQAESGENNEESGGISVSDITDTADNIIDTVDTVDSLTWRPGKMGAPRGTISKGGKYGFQRQMRRLGTKLGGKKGGRFMQKIFGKPGPTKALAKGAGRGLLKAGRWRITCLSEK